MKPRSLVDAALLDQERRILRTDPKEFRNMRRRRFPAQAVAEAERDARAWRSAAPRK